MAKIVKSFKVDDTIIKKYESLKEKEKLNSDSDFFRKMIEYTELMQSKQLVPIDLISEKDEKLNKVFFELGRLQGELKQKENILEIKEISLKEKNDLIQKLENEKEKALTEKDELIKQKEQFIEQLKLERENIIKQKEQLEKEIINFENEIKNKSLFKRIFWAINLKK